MVKKVHIISLGCPKNMIDAEVMAGLINQSGLRLVESCADADIVIINTCAFINSAKEEALEEILTVVEERKKIGRPFRIIVAGCLAQRYGRELPAEIPEVDLFVGVGEVGNIVHHINQLEKPEFRKSAVITKPDFLMNAGHPRFIPAKISSAYLKISDGCSNCCTYCAIPKIRGRARSRTPDDILQEAQLLTDRGIKEIIITGQDTTAYGLDLPGRPGLSLLLNEMSGIKGIKWIRLLYAHPAHLSDDVLETMALRKEICPYIDLPIQHIDDDILRAMNRRVTGGKIRSIIVRAREIVPDIALRTSIIVGFPGETPKRFERLLEFIGETKFDHLGVFNYSREDGTKAALLPARISEREKERRRESIMIGQAAISHKINQGLIGSRQEILIEARSDRGDYDFAGRCRRQAPEIDGIAYVKGSLIKIGSIVRCRITAADDYDLFAEKLD